MTHAWPARGRPLGARRKSAEVDGEAQRGCWSASTPIGEQRLPRACGIRHNLCGGSPRADPPHWAPHRGPGHCGWRWPIRFAPGCSSIHARVSAARRLPLWPGRGRGCTTETARALSRDLRPPAETAGREVRRPPGAGVTDRVEDQTCCEGGGAACLRGCRIPSRMN